MKQHKHLLLLYLATLFLLTLTTEKLFAQDSTEAVVVKKAKPVKNTFGSVWVMDNQTVMVPVKGSFELDIQHRFGTVSNGTKDMFGLFAPSNIRLGVSYSPIKKLYLGAGLTKERMQVDVNAKYALLLQTPGIMPVSVSYFTNMVIDARDKSNFRYSVDRFSYFNQLLIARKITDRFSAQVAPSFSWFNNAEAYVDSKGEIQNKMHNYHLAISVLGRLKITEKSSIIAGYDQPLTQHPTNNPHPNICFGFETTTSSHAFQVFAGNYAGIVPQSNNLFNQNDYTQGQFVVGFNITHLWVF
ncbi:DUF5777 family beta-barrel protein [Flavisolibacter ginsenosidimutans]|uniref:DUF5777 domain-containing protein n=1 Tax=Flavisolibacter ginsenosidimutans TaxID=661481 RepID=A0A5B8UHI2_9BACT|nr:DUF5777 family beta-barrel protein [Flavisolibacter ginsenosidimutans]QEC55958.1 hypothetical protein FSB75_08635 [Flavisolibacter ginsenosidimutans]